MAQFCTKCGSPLGDGMKFCTICGAVQGAPAAPAPPTQVIQPPAPLAAPMLAPPMAAVPVAAAPMAASAAKSSSPVMKIILIVVAVVIFLGLLSAASCVYFVYRAKQRVNQFEKLAQAGFPSRLGTREVQVMPTAPPQTPGAVPAPAATPPTDMGDLAYPGSTLGQGGNQSIPGAGGIKVQEYMTSDSVDTVVAYYKGKLGSNAMVTQSGGAALLQVGGPNGVTNITIGPDTASGKTKITVSSIGKQ